MPNEAEKLILRHTYLERYSAHLTSEVLKAYAPLEEELLNLFAAFERDATPAELDAFRRSTLSNPRVRALHKNVADLFSQIEKNILAITSVELDMLASSEVAFTGKILNQTGIAVAGNAILKEPVLGIGLTSAWSQFGDGGFKRTITAAVRGSQEGAPLTTFLKGSSAAGYTDGTLMQFSRQAATLVNTQVLGVANNARIATYKKATVSKTITAATLDFRTTPICRIRDGDVYDVGKAPPPPYHYNCRTIIVPYDGKAIERPFVKDSRPVKRIPKDQRGKKIGRTTLTYKQWFDQLPTKHQKEILGPARYKLYNEGRATLKQMVNMRTGKQYTLKQLDNLI